jgi:phage shock protein PspC (stress-responsive transcriptional regulator)
MQPQGNLFTRPDTFFGICEGLGEDTRIPANAMRVGLAVLLFFNPPAAFIAYAAAGVLVLSTRLVFPNPRIKAEPTAQETAAEAPAPALPRHAAENQGEILLAA